MLFVLGIDVRSGYEIGNLAAVRRPEEPDDQRVRGQRRGFGAVPLHADDVQVGPHPLLVDGAGDVRHLLAVRRPGEGRRRPRAVQHPVQRCVAVGHDQFRLIAGLRRHQQPAAVRRPRRGLERRRPHRQPLLVHGAVDIQERQPRAVRAAGVHHDGGAVRRPRPVERVAGVQLGRFAAGRRHDLQRRRGAAGRGGEEGEPPAVGRPVQRVRQVLAGRKRLHDVGAVRSGSEYAARGGDPVVALVADERQARVVGRPGRELVIAHQSLVLIRDHGIFGDRHAAAAGLIHGVDVAVDAHERDAPRLALHEPQQGALLHARLVARARRQQQRGQQRRRQPPTPRSPARRGRPERAPRAVGTAPAHAVRRHQPPAPASDICEALRTGSTCSVTASQSKLTLRLGSSPASPTSSPVAVR